ncbi:PH domain containing protein [Tritrichomonas foetus]|uniref:PH domain containing protein n=1 Tax=Tritrichomonas foetus TaxID=1144522 RepID=A0A1J4K7D4_9EUKA|nr:PH domain containing protein [Tritrichomonas foetus]|eukprot:OHT07393.1 PH domain containing protein [Tritrichomonas foetus]
MSRDGLFLCPTSGDKPYISPDAPKIKPCYIPITYKMKENSEEEIDAFNLNPIEQYDKIISVLGDDASPDEIAKHLFFSKASPHALSQLFFNSNLFAPLFPNLFYRSPVIDLLPFVDALHVLCPRVALPYTRSIFISFIKTIGETLYEQNFLEGLSFGSLCHLILCAISHSLNFLMEQPLAVNTFLDYCNSNCEVKNLGVSAISYLYKQLTEEPLILSYSFSDPRFPPRYGMSGTLSTRAGVMKTLKDVFVVIENDSLMYYTRSNKQKLLGGIPLVNIIFSSPVEKDKPYSFMISSETDEPIGFRIEKNKLIPLDKSQHIFYAKSQQSVELWRSSIMHIAFCKMVNSIIHISNW